MKKIAIIIISLVVLLIVGAALYGAFSPKADPGKDAFAKCLADKKVTMYGAYWCSHCQNQKKLFGQSFQYVPYVECTQETKKCEDQKITGYPTWIFEDGSRIEGEATFQQLSDKTSCPTP